MPDEIMPHLQALNQWLERQRHNSKQPSGLSAEERKQLQSVNKAIEQLRRSGVTVPADLRDLKLKLSSKDSLSSDVQENAIRLREVERLIRELSKTLKTARAVRDNLKSNEQSRGTKKHYGVTLLDLLQAGMLSVDDSIELQWLKDGPVVQGTIKADGTIMVRDSDGWQSHASLSSAASKVAGRSLNGWKHWRLVNKDGSTTALEDIRTMYIKEVG